MCSSDLLPRPPRLHVVPFLGLAVVHRPGALGAAWSTWSRTASIGRGLYVERLTAGSTAAARKCLLITCKIIIPPPDSGDPPDGPPYFTKKTFAPDCWDPLDGPSYFTKKTFLPLSARAHRKCLLITHRKMNTHPASWDPPWWEADLWAY